jgi:hypothetical protein
VWPGCQCSVGFWCLMLDCVLLLGSAMRAAQLSGMNRTCQQCAAVVNALGSCAISMMPMRIVWCGVHAVCCTASADVACWHCTCDLVADRCADVACWHCTCDLVADRCADVACWHCACDLVADRCADVACWHCTCDLVADRCAAANSTMLHCSCVVECCRAIRLVVCHFIRYVLADSVYEAALRSWGCAVAR